MIDDIFVTHFALLFKIPCSQFNCNEFLESKLVPYCISLTLYIDIFLTYFKNQYHVGQTSLQHGELAPHMHLHRNKLKRANT